MPAPESPPARRPCLVLEDEPVPGSDPLRWLADSSAAEEVWVDWQLCPPSEPGFEVAPSVPS